MRLCGPVAGVRPRSLDAGPGGAAVVSAAAGKPHTITAGPGLCAFVNTINQQQRVMLNPDLSSSAGNIPGGRRQHAGPLPPLSGAGANSSPPGTASSVRAGSQSNLAARSETQLSRLSLRTLLVDGSASAAANGEPGAVSREPSSTAGLPPHPQPRIGSVGAFSRMAATTNGSASGGAAAGARGASSSGAVVNDAARVLSGGGVGAAAAVGAGGGTLVATTTSSLVQDTAVMQEAGMVLGGGAGSEGATQVSESSARK